MSGAELYVVPLPVTGALRIEPRRFDDARGWFMETWRADRYAGVAGMPRQWVQDNMAFSTRHVLRGLHFQAAPHAQAKLVMVPHGTVWDVICDVRDDSPTRGQWCAAQLSAANGHQLFVPAGCAHGYVVLSETAVLAYKCDAAYEPAAERAIRWDDPELAVRWPVERPVLSERDARAPAWREVRTGAGAGA